MFGSNPNIQNNVGQTPLINVIKSYEKKAMSKNQCELLLHWLLMFGARPFIKDQEGNNAFMYAEDNGSTMIAQSLLSAELLWHIRSIKKSTKAHTDRDFSTIDALLDLGASLDTYSYIVAAQGSANPLKQALVLNPLVVAVQKNDKKLVKYLLNKGANVMAENSKGIVPLAVAYKISTFAMLLDSKVRTISY